MIYDDGRAYMFGHVTPEIAREIMQAEHPETLDKYLVSTSEQSNEFLSRQVRIALRNCGHIDPESIDDYIKTGGYQALESVVKATIRKGSSSRLKFRDCAAEAEQGSRPGSNGMLPGRKKIRKNMLCAMRMKVTPVLLWIAACWRVTRILCLKEWQSQALRLEQAKELFMHVRSIRWLLNGWKLPSNKPGKKIFWEKNIFGSQFSYDIIVKQGAGALFVERKQP
jgi:NADH-quinone oxidoreductase subunit F